jgi:hypothetical protein
VVKSRGPTRSLAAVVITAALCALVAPAHAQETTAEAAVQRVMSRRRYQRDLPDRERPGVRGRGTRPPLRGAPGAGGPDRPRPARKPGAEPGGGGGGGTGPGFAAGSSVCFWSVALLALATALVWLFRAWRNAAIDVALPVERASCNDRGPVAQIQTTDAFRRRAEDAATGGDFVTGAHLLLLGGLSHVTGAAVEDASTSREHLAATPQGSGRHTSLRVLVQTVEVGLFGGRPVDRAAFERCVASYEDLLLEPRS